MTEQQLRAWFTGNLPDEWFTGPVSIRYDRDEILVTGELPIPKSGDGDDDALIAEARIEAFREESRSRRMAIAQRAQTKFQRVVSWRAACGETTTAYTTASVPVMTRLRLDERSVLDTLIDAGVARSRSEALAWCVDLVGENEAAWIDRIRDAMEAVEGLRADGPESRR